jgi:hypothetical protein|mmetsp:Transcript_24072/g.41491  ORF Transcript_24072/g.41491 Transcript_24072/m.41491 type:complete len:85 (-) Transcript_24072:407-661(-)
MAFFFVVVHGECFPLLLTGLSWFHALGVGLLARGTQYSGCASTPEFPQMQEFRAKSLAKDHPCLALPRIALPFTAIHYPRLLMS